MNFRFVGIFLNAGSHSDIAANTIENNGDGVNATENSGVNLGTGVRPTFFFAPNTGQNNGFGVNCSVGGYVSGRLGELNGDLGPANIVDSCIDNLFPSPPSP